MKEAYCSYEISKLLKDKGFDECIFEFYVGDRIMYARNGEGFRLSELPDIYYPHITHQMACAWLREKKYISIVIDDEIPLSYKYIIKKYSITELYKVEVFKLDSLPFVKYEDAVESAIKYCLENLI